MKKIIPIALICFLCSCSSSSKKAEASKNAAAKDNEVAAPDEPAPAPAPLPRPAPKATPVSSSNVKGGSPALDEAIKTQNDEEIRKQAQLALMGNAQDVKALNALGLYNYKKGRFTAAKYFINKSLQVQATNEGYNNLGVVLLALNERKEALQAFRQALNINPQDGVAAANIGAIFVKEKDFNKAATALEAAYRAGYRDPKLMGHFALALTARGQTNQARNLYEKILQADGHNKEALLNYSILLIEHMKRFKDGLETLNRLKLVGAPLEMRERIKDLENKAKLGLQ